MRAKHHIILPAVEGGTPPIVNKEVNIATDKASHKQHANAPPKIYTTDRRRRTIQVDPSPYVAALLVYAIVFACTKYSGFAV